MLFRSGGSKGVTKFVSGNILLQLVGLFTGIAIVRGLSVQGYAEYSIYVGLLFGLISLSDSGMSGTLLSIGSRITNSPVKMAKLMKAGLRARQKLGLIVTLAGGIALWVLLSANEADEATVLVALVLLAITLQAVFMRGVWQVYFRANLESHVAQQILVAGALLRLLLVLPTWYVDELGITYILGTTAVAYWVEALMMKKLAMKTLLRIVESSEEYEAQLHKAISTVLPMNLANVFRAQLFIGLVTFFGVTQVIAETHALSRYAMAFAVLNAVVLEIISPRIARYQGDKKQVLRWVTLAMFVYALAAASGLLILQFASPWLLQLLGQPYAHLGDEFFIINAGAALLNMAVALGALNQSQNWISGSWTLVPFIALWAMLGIYVFDLTDSTGAAWFYFFQAAPLWATEVIRTIRGYYARISKG